MPYTHGKSIIRIAYADADLTLQELLLPVIDNIENCKVVFQATSASQLIEKITAKPETHLLISEILFPDMDGIEAAKKIKLRVPDIRILFLTHYKSEIVYSRILQIQGNGLVVKGSGTGELKRAIQEVMRSGCYFQNGPLISSHYHKNEKNGSQKIKNTFSDEEITFMKLIRTNLTYKGIASKMKCSKRHIDYIREGLFHRFDVHSKAELLGIASESGLLS